MLLVVLRIVDAMIGESGPIGETAFYELHRFFQRNFRSGGDERMEVVGHYDKFMKKARSPGLEVRGFHLGNATAELASEGGRYADEVEARVDVLKLAKLRTARNGCLTFQAADSERKTRWKRGPVNWTPTRSSPGCCDSATCTTRPLVAKSFSMRREA